MTSLIIACSCPAVIIESHLEMHMTLKGIASSGSVSVGQKSAWRSQLTNWTKLRSVSRVGPQFISIVEMMYLNQIRRGRGSCDPWNICPFSGEHWRKGLVRIEYARMHRSHMEFIYSAYNLVRSRFEWDKIPMCDGWYQVVMILEDDRCLGVFAGRTGFFANSNYISERFDRFHQEKWYRLFLSKEIAGFARDPASLTSDPYFYLGIPVGSHLLRLKVYKIPLRPASSHPWPISNSLLQGSSPHVFRFPCSSNTIHHRTPPRNPQLLLRRSRSHHHVDTDPVSQISITATTRATQLQLISFWQMWYLEWWDFYPELVFGESQLDEVSVWECPGTGLCRKCGC